MSSPSPCCPPGSEPPARPSGSFLGSTSPVGAVVEIPPTDDAPSMPCYVTGAPLSSPGLKRVVLVFSDVFGYDSGHHWLFADALASRLGEGTAVVSPDLFRGNPMMKPLSFLPEKLSIVLEYPRMGYRAKFDVTPARVERDVAGLLFPWLRTQAPHLDDDVAASCVGFCFGAWVAARALGIDGIPLRRGAMVHPSFKPEELHGGSQADLARRTGAKPILLLPSGMDPDSDKPGGSTVRVLAEMRGGAAEDEISVVFPTMKHGWMTRGDASDPDVARCQEEGMDAIVRFLAKDDVAKDGPKKDPGASVS